MNAQSSPPDHSKRQTDHSVNPSQLSAEAYEAAPAELLTHPLWFYIKKNKMNFTLGMFFLLITNGLDALYPMVIMKGIDQVVAKADQTEILKSSLLFFLILGTLAGTRYAWRTFFGAYHTDSAEDLRRRIFSHFTRLNPDFFQRNPTGELMSLLMNDVQAFRNGIGSSVLILVDGVIIASFLIPFMIYLNPSWTWKTLLFLPLVPFLIGKITKSLYDSFKVQQERISDWSGFSQESVAGIKVLKSFGLEDLRTEQHNKFSRDVEDSANRSARIDSYFMPVMSFGASTGSVILLLIAGQDVLSGAATIGTLVAFQRYIAKMTWPMTAFGYGTSQYQKGMASFDRIKKILQESPAILNEGSLELKEFQSLEVKNLSFAYGERKILDNVSFHLKNLESLGIIGPVGCGKTCLLHLLCRFYPASSGSILINGISIEKYELSSLRSMFNLVAQEPFLFSESIHSNIESGQNLTEAQTQNLLKTVDLWEEVDQLPTKVQSQLGEKGVNLSGGQKQRLALARGIARGKGLMLLDDVLSAVDSKTERKLIQSLSQIQSSRIIVSHKMSAVQNCEQILVMLEGKIIQRGSHRDLLETSSYYQEMNRLQSEENTGSERQP